jgi:hypothetical protein
MAPVPIFVVVGTTSGVPIAGDTVAGVALVLSTEVFAVKPPAVITPAAGLTIPTTPTLTVAPSATAQVVPSATVTTALVVEPVAVQPVPVKPETRVMVGVAGIVVPGNVAEGKVNVTVLPAPATIAEVLTKVAVHVVVAAATAEVGTNVGAPTTVAPAKVDTPRRAMDMTINTAANLFTCLMGLKRDAASRPSVE